MTTQPNPPRNQAGDETMAEHLQTNHDASVDQQAHAELHAAVSSLQEEVRQLRTDLQRFMQEKSRAF